MKYASSVAALAFCAAAAACSDASRNPTAVSSGDVTPALAYSGADAPARGFDEGGNWLAMSTDSLWDAIEKSGGLAHVGLKAPDRRRGVYNGSLLVTPSDWDRGEAAVLAIAGVHQEKRHDRLPVLRIRISDRSGLEQIRRLPFTDYVEPARLPQEPAFAQERTSLSSGCGYPGWGGSHYVSGGDIIPHRFALMGIENAWRRSRGAGVVVGVVDTGLDSTQEEMIGYFASGQSAGRVVRPHSVIPHSLVMGSAPAWDGPCSHGSRMAGLTTAPRNSTSTVGVAYQSHLIGVRFTDGVVDVDAWDASRAIDYVMTQHPDLSLRRVIPMAWRSAPSAYLNDVINWYYSGGVLFVGAVGQSECINPFRGVAWPARMEAVVAVGAVEDDNTLPCRIHRGPETEIVSLMDFPVPGEHTGQVVAVRESSSATAIVAGVAALIWARYPNWSRDQVRARIQESGHYYPHRDDRRGFGIINAYRAVGGFESLHLGAPQYAEPGSSFTATAWTRGEGPFTYLWSNSATTPSTTFIASGSYNAQNSIWVSVTDQVEGVTRTSTATVISGYEPWEPTCDPNLDPMCPA